MSDDDLMNLNLPFGEFPSVPERPTNPEITEAWQRENRRLRHERGDFAQSETPVGVPFVMLDDDEV